MGVRYVATILSEEAKEWLREKGVAFPEGVPSRWPTPNELRSVLESFAGYSVSYGKRSDGGWNAEITDPTLGRQGWHAEVWTKGISDDDKPHEFHFYKSKAELVLLILEKLSHVCGPFVFFDDAGFEPSIVAPGTDVMKLAEPYQ
jgi:hypothetical protein